MGGGGGTPMGVGSGANGINIMSHQQQQMQGQPQMVHAQQHLQQQQQQNQIQSHHSHSITERIRQISEVPGINSHGQGNNSGVNNQNAALINNITLMRGRFESNFQDINGFLMNNTAQREFISNSTTPVGVSLVSTTSMTPQPQTNSQTQQQPLQQQSMSQQLQNLQSTINTSSSALLYRDRNLNEGGNTNIRNVWVENFETELPIISELLEKYPYVAMDTEFPGVVIDEISENYRNSDQREYLKIKSNVDILKIIQIGITLSDENGNLPEPVSTWQFNFNFDIDTENKSSSSIALLQNSGIDFQQLKRHGIHPLYFAEKVTQSGLVLNDRIHWICFHGSYDFAYLLKIMMNELLPKSKENFYSLLKIFFPNIYDIKTFQHEFSGLIESGGLNRIADQLDIQRIGITHQAGSDSLVTSQIFFKLKQNFTTIFPQILQDYNLDVYGFNNDQAYPSINRAPGTIHQIDPLASNNFDDNDATPHELFFNYAQNNSDYDGGFFYNGLNTANTNNVDLNVFQPLRATAGNNSQNFTAHFNQQQNQQYLEAGKKTNNKLVKDMFLDGSNTPYGNNGAKAINHNHLHLQSTTPPPMMGLDNQFIMRNLTPSQSHGLNIAAANASGLDLLNHQYSQHHHSSHHQQPQWNYYNGSNSGIAGGHSNSFAHNQGAFYN